MIGDRSRHLKSPIRSTDYQCRVAVVYPFRRAIASLFAIVTMIIRLSDRAMNDKLKTILTELRQELQTLYGKQLVKIVLFGSQARGDAKPDSDIDVLIVLADSFNYSEEIKRTSQLIADLCLDHNVLVSCAFTTEKQLQLSNRGFFRNVRQEGVMV